MDKRHAFIEEQFNVYSDFGVKFARYNDFIYHYTSPKGMERIASSGKLWFTNADYLNDKEEGKYILRVLSLARDKYEKSGKAKKNVLDFLDSIKSVNNEMMFFSINEDDAGEKYMDSKLSEGRAYVCCFGKERDSLPMWRYYVKNNMYQGYSIGLIGSSVFYTREQALGLEEEIKIHEVIYNEAVQVNEISHLIDKLDGYADDKNFAVACDGFMNALRQYKYIYKNPCFESEREVRAIMYLPVDAEGVQYRMGHEGYMIPYVERAFDSTDMCVTISPLTDFELAKRSLYEFLESRGYDDVEIYKSECPIRY